MNTTGICSSRGDMAYQTFPSGFNGTLPPFRAANFTSRSYCIIATVREDPSNTEPLLHIYDTNGPVGHLSYINGRISHSLRGVSVNFSGNYTAAAGVYQQIGVCINNEASEALLYIDCVRREERTFVQSSSGILANMFVFAQRPGIPPAFQVK